MKLTKSELHAGGDDMLRKGWTNRFFHDMIDSLYREPFINRSSGFDLAGGTDSVLSWNNATRTLTLAPKLNRFAFWQYIVNISFFKRTEDLELQIPNQEGLYLVYIFRDETDKTRKTQKLFYIKNPSELQRREVYEKKVVVAHIYWDAVNGKAVYVGDDRHGSEWSPQIHWYLHNAIGARRKSGLYFKNMIVNGDGSSNDHAKFSIEGGVMLHDDFELTIPGSETEIPILNFYTDNVARFAYYTGFSVWKGNNRLCYNANQTHTAEADSGNFVIYHYFATNDILPPNEDEIHRKIISVMGTQEYTSLGAAYLNTEAELSAIKALMPMQGRCYIGSVIFQTADEYTNTIKARVVGLVGNEKSHPPVSIADDSKLYLEINDKQELRFLVDNLPDGADGRGIVSIILTSVVGLVKTYTITYTDETTSTFTVQNGAPGSNGRGIASIVLHNTVGKVKTYRITFTDSTYFDFEVSDGEDGAGGGGSKPIQVTGLTLLSANWIADGSLYKYVLSDAAITATSFVDVIPAKSAKTIIAAAEIFEETESTAGAVSIWATNIPTGNISVTINIFETA